jgi:hypothetical protein
MTWQASEPKLMMVVYRLLLSVTMARLQARLAWRPQPVTPLNTYPHTSLRPLTHTFTPPHPFHTCVLQEREVENVTSLTMRANVRPSEGLVRLLTSSPRSPRSQPRSPAEHAAAAAATGATVASADAADAAGHGLGSGGARASARRSSWGSPKPARRAQVSPVASLDSFNHATLLRSNLITTSHTAHNIPSCRSWDGLLTQVEPAANAHADTSSDDEDEA